MQDTLPPLPEPAIIGDNLLDGYLDPDAEFTATQMREYALAAVAAERERCAKVCEAMAEDELLFTGGNDNYLIFTTRLAAAIRRGAPTDG